MVKSETLTVYNFRVLEGAMALMSMAPFKATRAAIENHYRGEVLEGTAQEVDAEELDALGRYRRIATGWGDLA